DRQPEQEPRDRGFDQNHRRDPVHMRMRGSSSTPVSISSGFNGPANGLSESAHWYSQRYRSGQSVVRASHRKRTKIISTARLHMIPVRKYAITLTTMPRFSLRTQVLTPDQLHDRVPDGRHQTMPVCDKLGEGHAVPTQFRQRWVHSSQAKTAKQFASIGTRVQFPPPTLL